MLDDLAELRLQRESLAFMAARAPSVSEGAANVPTNARDTMRVIELGKQIERTLTSATKTLEGGRRRVMQKPQFQCSTSDLGAIKMLSGFGAVVK